MAIEKTAIMDYASLDSHIKQLETLRDEYRTAYQSDLYTKALDEVKSAFKGKDCDAFVSKVEEFRDDFDKMSDVITQYIDFLKKALKDYQNTQEYLIQTGKILKGNRS